MGGNKSTRSPSHNFVPSINLSLLIFRYNDICLIKLFEPNSGTINHVFQEKRLTKLLKTA